MLQNDRPKFIMKDWANVRPINEQFKDDEDMWIEPGEWRCVDPNWDPGKCTLPNTKVA